MDPSRPRVLVSRGSITGKGDPSHRSSRIRTISETSAKGGLGTVPEFRHPSLGRTASGTPSGRSLSIVSSNRPHPSLRTTPSGGSAKGRRSSDKERLSQFKRQESIAKQRAEKKALIVEEIRKEKITLLVFTSMSLVGLALWIIAVCIDHWFYVYEDPGSLPPPPSPPAPGTSNKTRAQPKFIRSNAGLWRVCRTVLSENTDKTWCKFHSMFPSAEEIKKDDGLDQHVIDYQRTEVSFAIMSIVMMVMGIFSAFYTFKNSRYMFKRLASGIYFLSASAVLMVLEVLTTSVRYEKNNVEYNHPKNSEYSYGFCFYSGWLVFLVYLVTAALFLLYSRKRKRDFETLDEDDIDDGQMLGR